ncbi:hypothetical protein [Microbacterium sp. NPDC055455]
MSDLRTELYDPPENHLRIEISIAEIRAEDYSAFDEELWAVIRRYSQWGSSISVGKPRQRGRVVSDGERSDDS